MADFPLRDTTPRIRRDYAVGSQRAAYVAVIGLGIELRVRQHHTNGHGCDSPHLPGRTKPVCSGHFSKTD
jgi:hypothetical protein